MQRFEVECLDGYVRSRKMNGVTRFAFRYKHGWFIFRGAKYHVDPTKMFRRAYLSPLTVLFLGIVTIESRVDCLRFKEGETEPLDGFSSDEYTPTGTGFTLKQAVEGNFMQQMLPAPVPWAMVIVVLVLGLLVLLAGAFNR